MAIQFYICLLFAGCGDMIRHADAGHVLDHSKFILEESGVISTMLEKSLRINVAGGEIQAGDPLVLWPCSPHPHEQFVFDDGLIRMMHRKDLCLNAAGGKMAGAPLIVFPCEQDGKRVAHEEFEFTKEGRIRMKQDPSMCINVKEGQIGSGADIILYPCAEDAGTPNPNELFVYDGDVNGGLIKVKSNPEFHFNVEEGKLETGAKVLLWSCQAALHEVFEFANDDKLHVAGKEGMCVNAEGGLGPGSRLIAYPCSEGKAADNEAWKYDPTRRVIYSVHMPHLGFNVKEAALAQGSEIVVWPIEDAEL